MDGDDACMNVQAINNNGLRCLCHFIFVLIEDLFWDRRYVNEQTEDELVINVHMGFVCLLKDN